MKQVNIPLLGSGAGSLSVLDSFNSLKDGLGSQKETDVIFEIFVPTLDDYKMLSVKYSLLSKTLSPVLS